MRSGWAYGLLLAMGLYFGQFAPRASAQTIAVDGSPATTQVVVGADGTTFVGVWITAPDDAPTRRERAPMDLSLVIDVSGSMSGEKIANARSAAQSVIETMREGDILSIYAFSDEVYEIAAPVVIGAGTRGDLIRRVGQLRDLGSTNLYGGLAAGIGRMRQAPPSHAVRRVVVLSDGQANVGPSDSVSLGNLAASGTEWHAQVTAIGIGLDYDENTLGQMAVRSSGRMYHLAEPSQMASILREEMGLLASTVATDVYIEVIPAPGVVIVDGLTMGSRVEGGRLQIPVGTLVAGQQREVLFRARVDTSTVGTRPLATARVAYRGVGGSSATPTSSVAQIPYTVTRDASAAARSESPRVGTLVATHEAAQASLTAATALRRGDAEAAERALARAEASMDRAAAAAPPAMAAETRARRDRIRSARASASAAATAGAGASAPAARGASLEAFDAAYEMNAY